MKHHFKSKGDTMFLKKGRSIIGYIRHCAKLGYIYYIGKPSDATVASFHGKSPLRLDEAQDRLVLAAFGK